MKGCLFKLFILVAIIVILWHFGIIGILFKALGWIILTIIGIAIVAAIVLFFLISGK